jgi:hypothetical protein
MLGGGKNESGSGNAPEVKLSEALTVRSAPPFCIYDHATNRK